MERCKESIPEGMTMSEEDIHSYSSACVKSLFVIDKEQPESMVCLLRGGYPPTVVVDTLAREFLDVDLNPMLIPTSDFLKNKHQLVRVLTDQLVRKASCNDHNRGRVITIDTAITGSSSRQFLREFNDGFETVVRRNEYSEIPVSLDYVLIRFWDKRPDRGSKTKIKSDVKTRYDSITDVSGEEVRHRLRFKNYNFGVRSLISEDNPLLLGIDYPYTFEKGENGGIHGQKSEYTQQVEVSVPITVSRNDGTNNVYQPKLNQSTGDLFLELILDDSRELIDRISKTDNHVNLVSLEFPPCLRDFCSRIVYERR